jgi:hypothetical protein
MIPDITIASVFLIYLYLRRITTNDIASYEKVK